MNHEALLTEVPIGIPTTTRCLLTKLAGDCRVVQEFVQFVSRRFETALIHCM
jgi:hypothetical protein